MHKATILFSLIIIGFGQQNNETKNKSQIAIGIIGGLNYVIYINEGSSLEETKSAPRINIGIDSRFRLTSYLTNVCELSYLRLFYNTKHNYWDTSFSFEDHITFDNIYISSELKIAVLRKGPLSPNIGIGFAGVWPFRGTWDDDPLCYECVNSCRALFLSGTLGLELDKYPFDNSLLSLAFSAHYCIARTSFPRVAHPHRWHVGVAISESIPLKLTFSLLFKI